jgi:HKD family nuclease
MTSPRIVLQKAGGKQVSVVLKEIALARDYEVLGVAVAFASVAGVTKFLDLIPAKRFPSRSYWLFGLDNFITHPDAIARAMKLKGAQVRVASEPKADQIFHPKLYWFSNSKADSSLVLGSANLTTGGLGENTEAIAILETTLEIKSEVLDAAWKAAWKLGKKITPQLLVEYKRDFEIARKARKKAGLQVKKRLGPAHKQNRLVLASDEASIDPSLASKCWIEVGKITGFQQDQLEIKSEQALFFGCPTDGGAARTLRVRLGSGRAIAIQAHYFGNHMWRLLLPQSIPEVRRGLRVRRAGRLLRSNYVAVFTRNRRGFELRFIRLNSREFKALRRATDSAGTLGHTTAREYGWV